MKLILFVENYNAINITHLSHSHQLSRRNVIRKQNKKQHHPSPALAQSSCEAV